MRRVVIPSKKPQAELLEAELVRATFILRDMDLPPNVKLTRRSLLRWFALASGLISKRESRSTILDVLDALFYLQISKRVKPTTADIQAYMKLKNREISEKLLRYHLKRLMDMGLLRRKKLQYSFNPSPGAEQDNLREAFSSNVSARVSQTLSRVEQCLEKLAESYKGQ